MKLPPLRYNPAILDKRYWSGGRERLSHLVVSSNTMYMRYNLIQCAGFLLAAILLSGCDNGVEPEPPSTSANKIMPLGASRVEGARPLFESYRYELWKQLSDGTKEFDFIGTVNDESTYPAHNGLEFDEDHEGRSGWTSGQINANLEDWLSQTGAPDIVLFSSPGGNDALENLPYDEAIVNINSIIDILQASNPSVTILIEKLAPAQSDRMIGELKSYFERIQEDVVTIAANQSSSTSQIIVVDMSSGFDDSLLADDVHYNEAGAKFVADRYAEVLSPLLE